MTTRNLNDYTSKVGLTYNVVSDRNLCKCSVKVTDFFDKCFNHNNEVLENAFLVEQIVCTLCAKSRHNQKGSFRAYGINKADSLLDSIDKQSLKLNPISYVKKLKAKK